MYVIALICRSERNDAEATKWMSKAATRDGFLPAFVELGRLAANGIGFKSPDLAAAYSVFRSSHRLGHRFALGYMAISLMMGAKRWLARAIGVVLWLPAMIRSYFYWRRHPLSERIFITPLSPRPGPLFKAMEK
jgi:hypothetical protein